MQPPSPALLAAHAPVAPLPGLDLVAHQSRDTFSLWQAWEEEQGVTMAAPPFWAVVWPAAVVLARFIAERPEIVRERAVVELGSGGGIAALAAARAGARWVVANDIDPIAHHIARANAAANGLSLRYDDRDRIADATIGDAEVILVADMFYEREVSRRAMKVLRNAAREGVHVWIADGGRPFAPTTGVEVHHTERVEVPEDLEGAPLRNVHVMKVMPS